MALYPDGISVRENDFDETRLTPDTDYAALVKACGGSGRSVHTPAEMSEVVKWALAEADQGRRVVLDVRLPQP
ncbi:MAG TPA: thiamine pyrophosphate-dependent enzyme [Mycobacterium sp.]|nr:thiamine pyrophosphate-dependent enzyme [Mycobacterium sp.]